MDIIIEFMVDKKESSYGLAGAAHREAVDRIDKEVGR